MMPDCEGCRWHQVRKTGNGKPVAVCGHPRILTALHIGPHVGIGPTGLLMHVAPRLCVTYSLFEPDLPEERIG